MLVFLALARKRSGPAEVRPGAEKRPKRRGLRLAHILGQDVDIAITTVADGIAFLRGDVSPLER